MRYSAIGFVGLFLGISSLSAASASIIDIGFEGVTFQGQADSGLADPICPAGVACDFRPGAKVFRARVAIPRNIPSLNPLEINLTSFFDPTLSPDEEALLQERLASLENQRNVVIKLWKQKSRELRAKRRLPPTRAAIDVPDDPTSPILLSLDYESRDVAPSFLTLFVTDTETGGFQEVEISLSVPEPGSMGLFAAGLAMLTSLRRRKATRGQSNFHKPVRSLRDTGSAGPQGERVFKGRSW